MQPGKGSESDSHGVCSNNGNAIPRACQWDFSVLWHASEAHLWNGLQEVYQDKTKQGRGERHAEEASNKTFICLLYVSKPVLTCCALTHCPVQQWYLLWHLFTFLTHRVLTVGNPALYPAAPLTYYSTASDYSNRRLRQLNLFFVGLPGLAQESFWLLCVSLSECGQFTRISHYASSLFHSDSLCLSWPSSRFCVCVRWGQEAAFQAPDNVS